MNETPNTMKRVRRDITRTCIAAVLAMAAIGCADDNRPLLGSANDDEPGEVEQVPSGPTLVDHVGEAQLVFRGEVVALSYATLTVPDVEVGELPHTYVTYRVIDGIKGGARGELVTLRFLGGPNEDGSLILKASHIPSFDVGDEDVLLVADNGATPCPLVDCAAGRFRVIDGFVYTDDGGELVIAPTGELRRGVSHDLQEVNTQSIGATKLALTGDSKAVRRDQPTADALSIDSVMALVSQATADDAVAFSATAFSVGPDAPFQP